MNKFKKGFTLSEVLVCIVIIGVIMALSVQTIKIVKTSYASLAHFAFSTVESLTASVYNGNLAGESNSANTVVSCTIQNNGVNYYQHVLKPDNYSDAPTGSEPCNSLPTGGSNTDVCMKMADVANTVGIANCGSGSLFEVQTGTEPEILITNINTPTFSTTNGFRYYLSKHVSGDSNVSPNYGYRLIAVDLNGKNRPNSSDKNSGKIPDIVTFLILDNGEVYPIGAAADNLSISNGGKTQKVQYINSKIKGYYFGDNPDRLNDDSANVPNECRIEIENSDVNRKYTKCNFGVTTIPNPNKPANDKYKYTFSYREAFCAVNGITEYRNYCNGLLKAAQCPPSTDTHRVDACRVENVKPMFRYSFN